MVRALRVILRVIYVTAILWIVATAGLLIAMYQQPETFASIVAKSPPYTLAVLPFRPLWAVARKGSVDAGEPAPDFDLERLDKQGRVQLSSHAGKQPVVLVFGSYT